LVTFLFPNDRFLMTRFCRPLATLVVALSATTLPAVAGAQSAKAAPAQSVKAQLAQGDKAYAARDAAGALSHFLAALKSDSNNVEALWKAAAVSVALGEFEPDVSKQAQFYADAEGYAKRAVALNPKSADAHFALAMAGGRVALTLGPMDRVKYATLVYNEATTCLKLQPKYAECMHTLGEWNAEAMRIDSFSRNMAINMLGATALKNASWANAERYLKEAIALQPKRAIHHLDLGRTYADMNEPAKAKAQFQAVAQAPVLDYNDPNYKKVAAEALKSLGS
jgi:tetratricopeptide (TPR) repeat protein